MAIFDPETRLLVIDLFQGPDVTGLVTERTRIRCETEDEHEEARDDEEHARSSEEGGEEGGDEGGEEGRDGKDEDDHEGDGKDEDDHEGGEMCGPAELSPGAIVHEAELELTGDGAVFVEIELVR